MKGYKIKAGNFGELVIVDPSLPLPITTVGDLMKSKTHRKNFEKLPKLIKSNIIKQLESPTTTEKPGNNHRPKVAKREGINDFKNPSKYGRVNDALRELDEQDPLLRKRQAYREGLPLDHYA